MTNESAKYPYNITKQHLEIFILAEWMDETLASCHGMAGGWQLNRRSLMPHTARLCFLLLFTPFHTSLHIVFMAVVQHFGTSIIILGMAMATE